MAAAIDRRAEPRSCPRSTARWTPTACDTFQAVAIKEVLAWQIEQAMKAQGLSRARLAELMGTSRSQIGRLLDPADGNVTLSTLQRAAEMVGRRVRLELI